MPADELAIRLGLAAGHPSPWAGRERRISVSTPGYGAECDRESAPLIRVLPDGQAELHSEKPGRLIVAPDCSEPESWMPQSLLLLIAQQWALQDALSLHAALVQVEGLSFLILGESGFGKSTLAMSALAAGGCVVTDDWLLVGQRHGSACNLRRMMRIRASAASEALLKRLDKAVARPGEGSDRYAIDPGSIRNAPSSARPDAIVLLRAPAGDGDRPAESQWQEGTAAQAAATIVNAAGGLLFSAKLPAEKNRIWQVASRLSAKVVIGLQPGWDAVRRPGDFWSRCASLARGAATA
jgi:hypothetical protein